MPSPEELAPLMAEFGKAYTKRLFTDIAKAGTTPARARLLMNLQCQGSCKMSQIGGALDVTPRSVTKLVDSLEAEGLVTREPHPTDRRATLIKLTPKGMLVCKESAMANHEAIARVYETLTEADRRHLARILGKLVETLNRDDEDASSPNKK
jgi:DNA-binding MarR family transcriptional regulator